MLLHAAGPLKSNREEKLSKEREPGDLKLVVQEIPLILEARLEQPHSEHPVRDEKTKGR